AGGAAAAAALLGVPEHLARRLQRQPAPDPAAVGGPGGGYDPGGRRGRALAGAGPVLGALLRDRRRRSPAGRRRGDRDRSPDRPGAPAPQESPRRVPAPR